MEIGSKTKMFIIFFVIIICFYNENSNAEKYFKSYREKRMATRKLEKNFKPPNDVRMSTYKRYLKFFTPEWANFNVSEEKVIKRFKNYFNSKSYRVIWNWDIDGDGNREYLGVEECPGVRRGIKKGIIVDEKGNEKLYIDTKKGVYSNSPLDIPLDLKKIGHRKDEVYCFTIGYRKNNNKIIGSGIGLTKDQLKKLYQKNADVSIGNFALQRLSRDLEVIGCGLSDESVSYCISDFIELAFLAKPKKVVFEMFIGAQSINEVYQRKRAWLSQFRKMKKFGKTFKPPKELNSKDIEIANEIYELMNTEIRK